MKNLRITIILGLYRAISSLLWPIFYLYLYYWQRKGPVENYRKYERLGKATILRPSGVLVWFHAASVGETAALVPLINIMHARSIHVLLTTTTASSAKFAYYHLKDKVIHQYAPFDIPMIMEGFLDYWRPELAFSCESEIWPARILELKKRRIPQILVNGRISEKSYQQWQKLPAIASYIFSKFDLIISQTEEDTAKYYNLGAGLVKTAGNLKAEAAPICDEEEVAIYKENLKKRLSWAAISTHEGEEELIIKIHQSLKKKLPNLFTIIVPRHLEHVEAIVKNLAGEGLKAVRKSTKEPIEAHTDILLGDTIGEMGFYLRLAEIIFVGKSLKVKGGHNPLEPAILSKAIISGPHVENFSNIYKSLEENKAVFIVEDHERLEKIIENLFKNKNLLRESQENAYQTAIKFKGALDKTIKILEPFLEPITMQAKLRKNR